MPHSPPSMTGRPLPPVTTGARRLALEVKRAGAVLSRVGQDGAFEGYASLFGVADLGHDVVLPGAFRDSIARRGPSGIKMLWQHDPALPIGVWTRIVEDTRGLFVTGQLDLAVTKARDLHALLKSGAVDGLSIGFKIERARKDAATGLRRLEKVDLWEISLVTFPMLPQARVSAVKRHVSPLNALKPTAAPASARPIGDPDAGARRLIRAMHRAEDALKA